MKTVIFGAGIIGISTAWHLLQEGHEVIVVDRQPQAAMETSFANAAQISVSYCEPWANKHAPLKMLQWMFRADSPLLFRPQLDWQQWRWGLQFLANCNDAAFLKNTEQIVALGAYSHAALKDVVAATGIDYDRLERGIAHYYTDQASFDSAGEAAALMGKFGVKRNVVSRDELLKIEPAYAAFKDQIVGGTFTPSDESGDARLFTQALAQLCADRGVTFLWSHDVLQLNTVANGMDTALVKDRITHQERALKADAFVVACGSYSAPLLRTVGVDLPIYPGKGYSATLQILKPEKAPQVSVIDDELKIAISRLGNQLRVAGTIELSGYNKALDTDLARTHRARDARRVRHAAACPRRQSQFLDGFAPRHPHQHPLHRPHQSQQTLGQRRPRHAGLDARRRIGQGDCALDQRQKAGDWGV
jgi:D-amino-acid dehydrogenase